MLALEVNINNCERFIVSAENSTTVHVMYGVAKRDIDSVVIFGADDSATYIWRNKALQKGDKIVVRVVDVDKEQVSSPQNVMMQDREKMKQEYEQLKMELQNKHLL